MNCQKLFQDFNSSKFVVYTSLLLFFILFALRLDHAIIISWWLVFAPLWIWKFLVITGALVGVLVWICNPEYRQSESSYTHFKSMLISLSLQLLLLMFELLVCDKLENDRHFWTLAFIPLIFISLLSVAVSVWALKNERDFELELICSVNVLQFIFIALRLDRFITWSWVVVFVPLWILLCLAIIGVLYALIFAVILLRTPEVSLEQRKASLYTAVAYILIVIPLLIFFVLLSSKLDAKEFRSNFIGPSSLSSSEPTSMIHIYSHISYPISNQNSGNILSLSSTQHHHQSLSTPMPPLISHSSQSQPSSSFATSPFFSPNYSFDIDYFTVCVPLYFTLTILICMSFSSKGGNLWWFGMRKDFCSFLLILCPCLREYANISYNFNGVIPTANNSLDDQNIRDQQQLQQQSLQNERTNLTSVQVDYDSTDTASGGLSGIGKISSSGKKFNKKKSMLTNNKNGNNNLVIPNLLRLDLPD